MKVIIIGRNAANDVVIADAFVSGRHLQLALDDNGIVTLLDLGSSNGTYVNGKRVTSAVLNNNDIIRIGETVIPWQQYFHRDAVITGSGRLIRRMTLGRSAGNDLVIADPFVSGSHASILYFDNGNVVIKDSGSSNGTFVNDQRITESVLKPGDRLRLAHTPVDWQRLNTAGATPRPATKKSRPWAIAAMITGAIVISALLVWGAFFIVSENGTADQPDTSAVPGQVPDGDLADVAEYVEKAVFLIQTEKNGRPVSFGTGFFVTPGGIAVTNSHVLAGGTSWKIKTLDGRFFDIEDVLVDNREYDYAIVRVDVNGNSFNYLSAAPADPRKGEEVFVIGNPQGIESTLSKGVIAGFRGGTEYDIMHGTFSEGNSYIQIDVAVSPGSSGSPVMTRNGAVIGIATLSFEQADCVNCNFAVNFSLLEDDLARYAGIAKNE